MHFYSIGYGEFLKLPIYTFWELAKNVDRLRAEEDRRQFIVVSQLFSKDPQKFLDELQREMGKIVEVQHGDSGFDEAGFNNLKRIMGQ
jgi:hypothetical protein